MGGMRRSISYVTIYPVSSAVVPCNVTWVHACLVPVNHFFGSTKGYISLSLNVDRHSCWNFGCVTGTGLPRSTRLGQRAGNPAVSVRATIGLESDAGCVGRLDSHVC